MRFFAKPYRYAALFSLLLAAVFSYALLDTFVIPKAMRPVSLSGAQARMSAALQQTAPPDVDGAIATGDGVGAGNDGGNSATDNTNTINDAQSQSAGLNNANNSTGDTPQTSAPDGGVAGASVPDDNRVATTRQSPSVDSVNANDRKDSAGSNNEIDPIITATSYKDGHIEIAIETIREYDTDIYIADIIVSGAEYIKTAFAKNTYGRNINDKTSVIAGGIGAIFAVNGDYYGFRDNGWVLRNGETYRSGGTATALLMDLNGDFSCEDENAAIEKRLPDLWQIWSFGPPLIDGGAICVSENQEISGRSSNSNPRTAIGQAGYLHYVFIVSDGRTKASAGLSLYELATLLRGRGCTVAYNLDGGGSSTMYFNGNVINKPTTEGRRITERAISDIVYIGY